MTVTKLKSDLKPTPAPYLTLTGKLWGCLTVSILEKIDRIVTASRSNVIA